jgi:hypothetical protein
MSAVLWRVHPVAMPAPSNPPLTPVSASGIRELLAAERDLHRRQRELVRASLVACPARRPAPAPPR